MRHADGARRPGASQNRAFVIAPPSGPAASAGEQSASAGGETSAALPLFAAGDVSHERPQAKELRLVSAEMPSVPEPIARLAMNGQPVTLDTAIAISLARDPTLVAQRATEPVAHAAYHVAEVYPWNPFVQVAVLPYARDREGDVLAVNHYVWLMQTIELAHQQRYREASAAAAWGQVRWTIVQAELTSVAQTERLYFTALYQRELRDLARRAATLNEELLGVVQRQFKAGLATAVEQTNAKVAMRQSDVQAQMAEANYRTAVLALQRQLNLRSDEPVVLLGDLSGFTWQPIMDETSPLPGGPMTLRTAETLAADLAQNRPDVLAARNGVSMARANANLARANQVQNVSIGPFYERDESGTVFAGFRTQMNLPIWDNGSALTAQRRAEQNLQWTTYDQLRARAEVEAGTAIERYERARRMVLQNSADQVGIDEAELQEIKQQFIAGQARILDVFNVQNSLLQQQRTYYDLLNEIALAAADVTLMAGLPPARVVNATSGRPREFHALPMP
ncbi:MAG: TolC family protein [Pirellulales bacterium]